MVTQDIIALLRKLKKDKNWLLNYILDSGEVPNHVVHTDLDLYDLLGACNGNLLANLLRELQGIEMEYESNGFPSGFDFIPEIELPPLERAIIKACNEHSIDYNNMTPMLRYRVSTFRCPFCGQQPLNMLDATNRKSRKCKKCGRPIGIREAIMNGKLRKLRTSVTKHLNDEKSS